MIKFLVFSRRGFANDRCMIAYDTDKVGNHIAEIYEDSQEYRHVDEKEARRLLTMGGEYAPLPLTNYASSEDYAKYGGWSPTVDDLIQLMLIHSYQVFLHNTQN